MSISATAHAHQRSLSFSGWTLTDSTAQVEFRISNLELTRFPAGVFDPSYLTSRLVLLRNGERCQPQSNILQRSAAEGWTIANLDATVILERPKLAPRKADIRASLARLLGIPTDRVNVKGKTHEKVDAVGEGRAVEVHAVVLLTRA